MEWGVGKWSVRDGRGVVRAYFDPAQVAPWRVGEDAELETDLARMREAARGTKGVAKVRLMFAMMIGGSLLSIVAGVFSVGTSAFDPLIGVVMVMQVAFIGMAVWIWRRGVAFSSKEALVDGYLACGRCPSCAYKIGHGLAEADGCVVCPECGGAWRV